MQDSQHELTATITGFFPAPHLLIHGNLLRGAQLLRICRISLDLRMQRLQLRRLRHTAPRCDCHKRVDLTRAVRDAVA
jgi:hypothetical protein